MRNYKEHLILKGSNLREGLVKLQNLGRDAIVFVVDGEDKLIGSLTDGDIRRALIKGIGLDAAVDDVIQEHPKYIRKGEQNLKKIIEYREGDYRILPVVDAKGTVVNVINFRLIRSYLPLDCVIMAGGRGTRLKPLTESTPKPLLKVGPKPIMEHNLDRLALYGIDDFWVTLKYKGEQIQSFFKDGSKKNIKIRYVWERDPLGTIGAVSQIDDFTHDYILVTNSDLLTNLDYERFFLDFQEKEADLSVITIPYKVAIPYAVLETSNGHVIDFKEKPTYTYYSNGGIYLIKRDSLNHLPRGTFFNATDLMEKLIGLGKKVISYPLSGYWLDIGKHEDFEKAQRDIDQIVF